jgi:hypothetical protein
MNKDTVSKLYNIIENRLNADFDGKSWKEWDHYLNSVGIESHGFENHYDGIDILIDTINECRKVVVCGDPWISSNEEYGWDGILIIPEELAEKILVLGDLP